MSDTERGKQAKTKDEQIAKLILENGRLKRIATMALNPCKTCARLTRHECWTLFTCPLLGYVDPEVDGCTKHKARTNTKGEME